MNRLTSWRTTSGESVIGRERLPQPALTGHAQTLVRSKLVFERSEESSPTIPARQRCNACSALDTTVLRVNSAKWPVSSLGSLLIAVVVGVGIFMFRNLEMCTPLQQWYWTEYLRHSLSLNQRGDNQGPYACDEAS